MACCLTAPSHYLNHCWLIIGRSSDIHLRALSQEIPQPSIKITLKNKHPKYHFQVCHAPRIQGYVKLHYPIINQSYVCQYKAHQNPNVSHLLLQLSLPNPLKPGVKSRVKISLEQCRQVMLQLHLSDQQFYCLLQWLILEVWRYSPFKWFDYMMTCVWLLPLHFLLLHTSGELCASPSHQQPWYWLCAIWILL